MKMIWVVLLVASGAFGQTIFIASNNKAANDIRKQLTKDAAKGKSCLIPVNDPAKAELRMDVNQGNPGSGMMGVPSVAVTVTKNDGTVVFSGDTEIAWTAVYRRMQKRICN